MKSNATTERLDVVHTVTILCHGCNRPFREMGPMDANRHANENPGHEVIEVLTSTSMYRHLAKVSENVNG